jgi:DNA modification methylase
MKKDLLEWLEVISVPDDGAFLHAGPGHDWSAHESDSFHGIVLESENSKSEIEEAYRVLKPGGHLFLVAPDEEPTGHTGACASEEIGFEVRDSILLVNQPEGFFYSGKTTTKEREAGCYGVEEKSFGMSGGANSSIDKNEDYDAAQSIGLNRITKRRNHHPTVKPRAVMQFLLSNLDTGMGPIMDPFMGSGTTGLACLRTGHDFVGIEREEEYANIADSRIRHWAFEEEVWVPVRIESDVTSEVEEEAQEVSFTDLFGI